MLTVYVAARLVDIEAEHFDIALRGSTALPDSSLVALRVGDAPLERIVIAAPSYIASNPAPRRPSDLSSHRIIGMSDTGGAYVVTLLRRGGEEKTDLRLPVAVGGSDGEFIKEMALCGAGIAIMPRLSVQRELDERRLVHLLPNYVAPGLSLFLLHRGGRFVPPKVRAFIDYARGALGLRLAKTLGNAPGVNDRVNHKRKQK